MNITDTVHLFVPCLVRDALPGIGRATLALLRSLGLGVMVPKDQTCCGQLLYKQGQGQGQNRDGRLAPVARRFMDIFGQARAVVAPSSSCVAMVRAYPGLFAPGSADQARAMDLAAKTFELSEFLVNVLGVTDLGAALGLTLNTIVIYHGSCQAEQALGLVESPRRLLAGVRGLTVLEPSRASCCGFGGGFSLAFPDISRAILEDKTADFLALGAEVVVGLEPSCLAHMDGYFRKQGLPLRAVHLAELLMQGLESSAGSDRLNSGPGVRP